MELRIGLPNSVAGTTGKQLTDWTRAAGEAGFSTLGTIDRLVYDSHESPCSPRQRVFSPTAGSNKPPEASNKLGRLTLVNGRIPCVSNQWGGVWSQW
jgi:hypothetical protein